MELAGLTCRWNPAALSDAPRPAMSHVHRRRSFPQDKATLAKPDTGCQAEASLPKTAEKPIWRPAWDKLSTRPSGFSGSQWGVLYVPDRLSTTSRSEPIRYTIGPPIPTVVRISALSPVSLRHRPRPLSTSDFSETRRLRGRSATQSPRLPIGWA